jgi:hypothetical protein
MVLLTGILGGLGGLLGGSTTPITVATPAPSCPLCGGTLRPRPDERPLAPPWACQPCARGWEDVELAPEAREAIRPRLRDFGDGQVARDLAELVEGIDRG